MVDETGPPFQSFAGGFFSGRVMSELREMAELTWYQMQSVDGAATVGSSMTSQTTGYQIQAAITNFTTVTPTATNGIPGGAAVLPQTSRPFPLAGLLLYVSNVGANPLNLFPHPNDPSNSINGLAANTAVVLGVNTITALQCITPGVWQADGIGEGFNAAIATTVSQGTIAASGSTNTDATQIVQAMVNVTASATTQGVALPKAKAGTQVVLNGGGGAAASFHVYPLNGSGDTGAGLPIAAFTNPSTNPSVFYCFIDGTWTIK